MVSGVKSRIASFEAQNQTVRSVSPAVRRPSFGSNASGGAGGGSVDGMARGSAVGIGRDSIPSVISSSTTATERSQKQHPLRASSPSRSNKNNSTSHHPSTTIGASSSTLSRGGLSVGSNGSLEAGTTNTNIGTSDDEATLTISASDKRKSRLRQQQLETASAIHHPINLMEKRKQIKARRMRAAEAAASGGESPTKGGTAVSPTAATGGATDDIQSLAATTTTTTTATKTAAASSSSSASKSVSRRMIAARNAGRKPHSPASSTNNNNPHNDEHHPQSSPPRTQRGDDDKPAISPRLNHFHGSAVAATSTTTPTVITPTQSVDTVGTGGGTSGVLDTSYMTDEQSTSSPTTMSNHGNHHESRRTKMKRMNHKDGSGSESSDVVAPPSSSSSSQPTSATPAPGTTKTATTTKTAASSSTSTNVALSHKKQKARHHLQHQFHQQQQSRPQQEQQPQQPAPSTSKGSPAVSSKKTTSRETSRERRQSSSTSMTSASNPATTADATFTSTPSSKEGRGRRSSLREEVRHSQSGNSSHKQKRRHQKQQQQSSSSTSQEQDAVLFHRAMLLSPPESPPGVVSKTAQENHSHKALEPAGFTLSPSMKHPPFGSAGGGHPQTSSHSGMSPRSGTDVGSDILDQSMMDPGAMDDDATLTSVRRVMGGKSTPSSSSKDNHNNKKNGNFHSGDEHSDEPFDQQQGGDRHSRNGRNHPNHQKGYSTNPSSNNKRGSVFRNHPGDDYNNNSTMTSFRGSGSMGTPTSAYSPSRNRNNNNSNPSRSQRRNSGNSNNSNSNRRHHNRNQQEWMEDEKSDKAGGVFQAASSSDYGSDGENSKNSRGGGPHILDGPSHSQATDVNEFFNSRGSKYSRRTADDDERTFDYGDREGDEEESTGSASNGARRHARDAEKRRARDASTPADTPNSHNSHGGPDGGIPGPESPLINQDDVEHYTKSLDTPGFKVGAGVVGAATIGCFVLGPVGLLVGAAAVGIGVGVMQIPEEQRSHMRDRAKVTFHDIHDKALDASESLSSSCVATYKDSGMADHLHIPHCLSGSEVEDALANNNKDHESTHSDAHRRTRHNDGNASVNNTGVGPDRHTSNVLSSGPEVVNGGPTSATSQNSGSRMRNKKVACLRDVRIIPVGQIHGLDPTTQPRAWLDVMASAATSEDEKNEAMEEISILAKDKRRARIFLDEGILDSLMWILNRYFEKVHTKGKETSNWAFPDLTPDQRRAAKLAATCCVTLGKAHCAAFHTEGDLLLMSLYERGTVPEERQVAQMLHEVPHHVRVTKTPDPTLVEPSQEVFALKQMTLPQAEELARAIKAVADG